MSRMNSEPKTDTAKVPAAPAPQDAKVKLPTPATFVAFQQGGAQPKVSTDNVEIKSQDLDLLKLTNPEDYKQTSEFMLKHFRLAAELVQESNPKLKEQFERKGLKFIIADEAVTKDTNPNSMYNQVKEHFGEEEAKRLPPDTVAFTKTKFDDKGKATGTIVILSRYVLADDRGTGWLGRGFTAINHEMQNLRNPNNPPIGEEGKKISLAQAEEASYRRQLQDTGKWIQDHPDTGLAGHLRSLIRDQYGRYNAYRALREQNNEQPLPKLEGEQ